MSYETNYMKGLFSSLIMTGMITIMFYVLIPVWASFSNSVSITAETLGTVYPLSGVASNLANLTASINVAFFMIILFPIVYLLILPFMREPQEEVQSNIGGNY